MDIDCSGRHEGGSCWDKPQVNAPYQQAVRQHAQELAQAASGGVNGQPWTQRESAVLSKVTPLRDGKGGAPDVAQRWKADVSKVLRFIRDGPQDNKPSPLQRIVCLKCKSTQGMKNATHAPLCLNPHRVFKYQRHKDVFLDVKKGLEALIQNDARWTAPIRGIIHDTDGSTSIQELAKRRSVDPKLFGEGAALSHDSRSNPGISPPVEDSNLSRSPAEFLSAGVSKPSSFLDHGLCVCLSSLLQYT